MHNGQSGQKHWTRAGKAEAANVPSGVRVSGILDRINWSLKRQGEQTETQDSETAVRQIAVMVREMN